MTDGFTLPRLESLLDQLRDGQKLALAHNQVDDLFGLNGVRSERLRRFASGHACIIIHENSCVVFEKRKPEVEHA